MNASYLRSPERSADTAGTTGTAGQALGVAVLATVLAATRPVAPDLGGYHLAFVVAAVAMAARSAIASRCPPAATQIHKSLTSAMV